MRKILKYAAIALVLLLIAAGIVLYVMSRPDVARFSTAELSGRVPVMASQRNEIFPTMNVPEATRWPANQTPTAAQGLTVTRFRSEEHTSELQSLMRISYAVFCLKKK